MKIRFATCLGLLLILSACSGTPAENWPTQGWAVPQTWTIDFSENEAVSLVITSVFYDTTVFGRAVQTPQLARKTSDERNTRKVAP